MHDTKAFYPLYFKSTETAVPGQLSVAVAGTLAPSVVVAASNGVAVASAVFPGTTNNNYCQIQICNETSVFVHVNFGVLLGGMVVTPATGLSYPVAPGSVVVVTVDPEVNAASVYADSAPAGSTSVLFTRGEGV